VGCGLGVGFGNAFARGFLGGRSMYSFLAFTQGPYALITPLDFGLDAHATVGLGWAFSQAPVDLYADFSPGLLLIPDLNLGSRLTVGGRFWF
jgi:hypothetical protein